MSRDDMADTTVERGSLRSSPLDPGGQQAVEEPDEVQPLASDAGGEEDGRQAVSVHVTRTRQRVLHRPHLLGSIAT